MKQKVAVSRYSLRQLLGPIHIMRRNPDGTRSPFTWGEQQQKMTLLEFPGAVKQHLGLSAIEICQFHISERSNAYIDDLKGTIDKAGVELLNMPIDVGNISVANEKYREEDLADIEGWIQAASRLGSRRVRVNASAPMDEAALGPIDVTIASLRRLADKAASLGMQLLTENHGGITTDAEVIVKLVEGVGGGKLKTLVDIGNFDPVMSANMAAFREGRKAADVGDQSALHASLKRIVPFAALVHAKSLGFYPDGRTKVFDSRAALQAVKDAGYQGPFSLEYEGEGDDAWGNARKTLKLVEDVFA